MEGKRKWRLIYENKLGCPEDIQDFVLEGSAILTFSGNRLRMENAMSAEEGQRANYVLWCPVEFPADVRIEWDFWPIAQPGLCMTFFAAKGRNGEDLFDPALQKRTGEYPLYHHGDINAFHASYFRRKEADECVFHTCNLRKSYGFYLTAQGGDPIPDVADASGPYRIAIEKVEAEVAFYVNELEIFRFKDDGVTYGPLLDGGKIGFRQLAPMVGEYANLAVYTLAEKRKS